MSAAQRGLTTGIHVRRSRRPIVAAGAVLVGGVHGVHADVMRRSTNGKNGQQEASQRQNRAQTTKSNGL